MILLYGKYCAIVGAIFLIAVGFYIMRGDKKWK